jgi:hypothetical protein
MDEKIALELLECLQSQATDIETIQPKIEQSIQAINWAHSLQRWDLVIAFATTLSYHFEYSPSLTAYLEEQGSRQPSKKIRYYWEQAVKYAKEGLIAAERIKDQEKQLEFLATLSRLLSRLNNFELAFDYLEQELHLIKPDMKWRIAREFYLLGNQASELETFSVARICYQMSLKIWHELNNFHAIAEVIPFLIANETKQVKNAEVEDNQDALSTVISQLWELSDVFRQEALHQEDSIIDQARSDELYKRLETTLTDLNSMA